MGQKVHPGGMRLGIIHDWKSHWYSEKDFANFLIEDLEIRAHIRKKLRHAALSDIHIKKDAQKITIDIHTARPGIVIIRTSAVLVSIQAVSPVSMLGGGFMGGTVANRRGIENCQFQSSIGIA